MSDDNSLANIRNVLGFLLAGFGAILSFLGIRSSEVSTILRNDSPQATVIALIMLLGVLAAVSAIVAESKKRINLASAAAIGAVLFGLGALVIFAIPVEQDPFTISGIISLAIGCVFVSSGTVALARLRPFWVEQGTSQKDAYIIASSSEHGTWRRLWMKSAARWQIDLIDVLILTSVLLTAIAAYGAIRLESKSQLSFSSQIGATFSVDGPLATVSIDISATKIPQADWVVVYVYAVPEKGISLESSCETILPGDAQDTIDHCMTDPCVTRYFGDHIAICNVLLNGSIDPSATGDIDETLQVPFLTARYQDVDVRAEVCSPNPSEVCVGSAAGQNSRLDWNISQSAISPG
jgi:hypothetical protein